MILGSNLDRLHSTDVGNGHYMPWITEPGLWLQWDYAAGPMLAGERVVLFVGWLAWSRFRVVIRCETARWAR